MQKPGGLESDMCKEVKEETDDQYGVLDQINVDSVEENSKEGDMQDD